ncbi:hypothetical protein CNYM01_06654 [Colletotrichum nymphaeae SA-01]|uniref:Uncharacterized protein n=1 Tax=Colletotrichum nymphaeae SA-01 TaxID=1460502 RepID=A0A135UWC0_9PEZI|nr:hypothetical protein CNYM01_06654 [Colletotrichum nymphaeae SA-01]
MNETALARLEVRLLGQRIVHPAERKPLDTPRRAPPIRQEWRRRHRHDPVPAAPHGHGVRVGHHGGAARLGAEVRPPLHQRRLARRVAQRKGVVVGGRVGEVEGAGRGVDAAVGVEQREDVLGLVVSMNVLHLLRMRPLVKHDIPPHPPLLQHPVQLPQRRLRIVPAPALVHRDVHVLPPQRLDEVQHGLVPVRPDHGGVVVVHARDVDALRAPRAGRVVARGRGDAALVAEGVEEDVEGYEKGEVAEGAGAEEAAGAQADAVEEAHGFFFLS